ncbi:MAG: hypothetical protein GWP19_06725 [Planctomycetia bacterium]|nr:hypothetical protein [Planctomycetia bacterium]
MKIKIILAFSILILVNISHEQLVDPMHTTHHGKELSQECMVCHRCEKGQFPTKANLCLQQCTRPFLPKATATQDVVIIDRLMNKYEPVVFAHNLHATMSAMSGGCNNCHHFTQSIDDIKSCGTSGCHSDTNVVNLKMSKPSLKGAYHRQCLGCHREWSHDTDCSFCHAGLTSGKSTVETMDKTDIVGTIHPRIVAKPAYIFNTSHKEGKVVTFHHTDHVNLFGLKCTDCHKGDNCALCHDIVKPEKKFVKHVETCCRCHLEDNCNFCHSNTPKPPFEHYRSTSWALNKYHKDLQCSKCHGPLKKFTKPSTVCTNCHIHWDVGVFDHGVTGLVLNDDHIEEDCEVCHIDRDFSTSPSCGECHDDISYPDDLPGERLSH